MSVFGSRSHPVSENVIVQLVKEKHIEELSSGMIRAMRDDTIDLLYDHAGNYMEVGDEEFDEVRLLHSTVDEIDFILRQRERTARTLATEIDQRYWDYQGERVGGRRDRAHAH